MQGPSRTPALLRTEAEGGGGRRQGMGEGSERARPCPAHQAPAGEEGGREPSWRNETLLKTENRANQGLQTGMWTRSKTKTTEQKGREEGCRKDGRGGARARKGKGVFFFSSSHFFKKPTQEKTHTHNQRLFPSRNINRAESNTLFLLSSKSKKKKKKSKRKARV